MLAQKFEEAREQDQKWMPQIFMLGHDGKLHDFVPLLDPNHLQLAYISLNQFPKNASFHFSGYNGVDDHDKVVEDIKSSARQ